MNDSPLEHQSRELQQDALRFRAFLKKSQVWLSLVLALIAVTPLLGAWAYYSIAAKALNDDFRQLALDMAGIGAGYIDAETHATAVALGAGSKEYAALQQRLTALSGDLDDIQAFSTYVLIGDEPFRILDTGAGASAFMAPFTPADVQDLGFIDAIGSRQHWSGMVSSPNGQVLRACSPLQATNGAWPSVLCMTLDSSAYRKSVSGLRKNTILVSVLAVLLTLLVIYSVLQHQRQLRLSLDLIQKQRDLFLNNSLTDALTGALNRRAFHLAYASAQSQLQRNKLEFAVITLDIDDFKLINDTHGHDCGDTVLAELVRNLRMVLRSSDHLARMGGEEFSILCNIPDTVSARRLADKLRHTAAGIRVNASQGETLRFTISLGIYIPAPKEDLHSALKCADQALYWAKKNGKNRAECFDEELAALLAAEEQLES